MNRKLDKMKADIQNRIKLNAVLQGCALGFILVSVRGVIPVQLDNEQASEFVLGFQLGLVCVLMIAFLSNLVKYRKALRDEKALKQLYYKENDERMCYINQQVGKSSMSILTVLMVIATIITGYFNITVFCTMIAVTLFQGIIQIVLKWYYTNSIFGESAEEE